MTNGMKKESKHHDKAYHKPQYQLLEKEALVGPVTALALETCSTTDHQGHKADVNLCLVARGPYINIVPLHNKYNSSSSSSRGSDKNIVSTHLAFGRQDVHSGTVHGIHKVSNCSQDTNEKLSLWAFHGSRKLSFALIDVAAFTLDDPREINKDSTICTPVHVATDNYQKSLCKPQPYLNLTDWIWDVRVLATDTSIMKNYDDNNGDGNGNGNGINSKRLSLLTAIGMAQNTVEIWSLSSMKSQESNNNSSVNNLTLNAIKLRKIICNKRLITYSLSFYGWKNNFCPNQSDDTSFGLIGNDLSLAVAVGTVSNQILIWNAIDKDDGKQILDRYNNINDGSRDGGSTDKPETSIVIMSKKKVSHTLSGHMGVIYSCKFGVKGAFIVSTSDDRTVRLWKRNDHEIGNNKNINDPYETPSDVKLIINGEKDHYSLQWTGFGHAARVWDCDFTSLSNENGNYACGGIISSGEDATLKIWDMKDGSLISTMKGHASQSIWKICSGEKRIRNADSSFAVSGANDGSVNIWNIPYQVSSYYSKSEKFMISDQQQVMCGVCFYPAHEGRQLLVATRSAVLSTLNLETKEWVQHGFWPCLDDQDNDIKPEQGSCMAMHPTRLLTLIGTTRGDMVFCSIQNPNQEKITCSARKYLAIQSLSWLDDSNFLAFHVKGIVVWWEVVFSPQSDSGEKILSTCQLRMKKVLSMKTTVVTVGLPMCYYHDKKRELIFIGDSRGNIALFDCKSSVSCDDDDDKMIEQTPTDLLIYAHKKEHVTCIIPTSDDRGILSAGNDGRLHEITLSREGTSLKLKRSLSRPISSLTGVSYLWRSKDGALIAGGYYGNEFAIVDVTTNRRLLRVDSGGRTRRLCVWIDIENTESLAYTLAICVANKKTPSEIIIYSSPSKLSQSIPPSLPYALSVPFHGETVLDVALCNMGGKLLLLSGSNDCSVKLSTITKSSISLLKELPPHESCIRALCFSRHSKSSSALIVVCGGKLMTSFYRLDKHESGEVSVNFLCTNKLPIKQSIDHRMNAVKAIPLCVKNSPHSSHLVLAGDSDGALHLTIVTEEIGQSRKVSSSLLTKDARPILSIDMVRLSEDMILACVGTTAGDVDVWVLSEEMGNEIPFPSAPVLTYRAHTMGANCISAVAVGEEYTNNAKRVKVMISSGGDDQAVSLCLLCITIPETDRSKEASVEVLASSTKKEACVSAIKGINIVGDSTNGFRIFTTGYDQRLAMWMILIHSHDSELRIGLDYLSSTPVDIKDINSVASCVVENENENDGKTKEYVIAGGEGLEVLSFDQSIWQAAQALRKCDNLLITCGAGFSADSGLATYESMPKEYRELCNPLRLVDSPTRFQQFWLQFAKDYKSCKPHRGYSILEQWCQGEKLSNLKKKNQNKNENPDSPWWVYSSNVDGHFGKFDCFENTICEIHGRATDFRCANGIGYKDGIKRDGELWDEWNNDCSTSNSCGNSCKGSKVAISEMNNESYPLRCNGCELPLRPNVLMFHDTDENVLKDISHSRQRYQEWEALAEQDVIEKGRHLVILELGAGENVPAVREESEEVFHDVLERIQRSENSCGSVTLIRINPKDAGFVKKSDIQYPSCSTILISEKAEHALSKIDQALGQD